jgi:LysM repeat protein
MIFLWKIAKKYGLSWQELAEYNELKNPHLILVGQKLKIPVGK